MCGQNESLFVFFGSRGFGYAYDGINHLDLPWSLTMVSNGTVNSIAKERRLLEGKIPSNETLPQFVCFRAPSRAWMKFTPSIPNDTKNWHVQ